MKTKILLLIVCCSFGLETLGFAMGRGHGPATPRPITPETRLAKLPIGTRFQLLIPIEIDRAERWQDGKVHYLLREPLLFTREGRLNQDIPLSIRHCRVDTLWPFSFDQPVIIPAGTVFTLKQARETEHSTNIVDDVPEGEEYSHSSLQLANPEFPQLGSVGCTTSLGSTSSLRVRDFVQLLGTVFQIL